MRTQHTTVPLQSIGCGSTGRAAVERSLRELPGVPQASVNPVTEMAYVEFDPAQCRDEDVLAAVRRTGYGESRTARSPAPIESLRWSTYPLGVVEAFVLGLFSGWLFVWGYNAIQRVEPAQSTRANR